ncbi:MAG: cupin domain-containing protein [Planctomycetes bacterium]|nr:cupin domain-containing protein [Planctomycetota bacterium]
MKLLPVLDGVPAEPKVMRLAELLAHQPGAVVSRQVLKHPSGSVTVFAFAAGEGLSEHTAPFDALVQLLEGTARITIGGRPYELAAGDAIVMPAHRPHALAALTPFKMVLTMLRPGEQAPPAAATPAPP